MSTLATLVPYAVSAIAEIRHSARSATAWAVVAIAALIYALVAIVGAGLSALMWGAVLLGLGVPVFYGAKQKRAPA